MGSFGKGLRVQVKVFEALARRELMTRFGRENIGFLWIMAEPLLFAGLVGIIWSVIFTHKTGGISVFAFVMTGYLPLTFMRNSFSRSANVFVANSALLYHRQIKVQDFVFVRVAIETAGAMMAFLFAGIVLGLLGYFPVPADIGSLIAGWGIYVFFVAGLCMLIAPLSEVSEVVEKLIPLTTYIAIPFSGAFNLMAWLSPELRELLMWSPMVSGMELMRYGVFGSEVTPYYDVIKALSVSLVCWLVGLILTRRVRRTMSVS